LDACYCVRDNDYGHMGITTCARVRDMLKDMGMVDDTTKVYVNHFSHNGNATHAEMVEFSAKYNMGVAHDKLCVEF